MSMLTNQEIYDNGEIIEIQHSRTIHSLVFYYYIIKYGKDYYEIEVSDDGISQEVEEPNQSPRKIDVVGGQN